MATKIVNRPGDVTQYDPGLNSGELKGIPLEIIACFSGRNAGGPFTVEVRRGIAALDRVVAGQYNITLVDSLTNGALAGANHANAIALATLRQGAAGNTIQTGFLGVNGIWRVNTFNAGVLADGIDFQWVLFRIPDISSGVDV